MRTYRRWLIPIVLIVIFAIWVDLPNNPGIHIGNTDKDIETRLGLDLVGGVQALMEADLPPESEVSPEAMRTARTIVENRVNGLGVTEALVQLAGDRRILVELPGEHDPEKAIATIKQTALLEFVDFGPLQQADAYNLTGAKIETDFGRADIQPTPEEDASGESAVVPIEELIPEEGRVFHTILTGAMLKNAFVTTDEIGNYMVALEFTDDGADLFATYTTQNVGKILAIVLDKEVVSTPSISEPITGGNGVINGEFTYEEANNLAIQLRYGALPVPLKVVNSSTVGPTLGQDSLQKSMVAGVIGMAVVVLFMALYYRLPGLLADVALLIYALLSMALFRLIPVTLTLPGIAGFVLSIGVAVDANVLIFERLKEELRAGRSLRQAIDLGWQRAWPSIRDSNLSTLITCGILFWFGNTFGASIVKGFSLTLAIGVMVSLFTAITVTRTFLHLVLDNIKATERPTWFGV
jgi:preprotein translocase subunit SecD